MDKKREWRNGGIRFLATAGLIALPLLLKRLATPQWVSEAFKPASRFITRLLSYIFGFLPFSAAEMLLYLLLLGSLGYVVHSVVRVILRKRPPVQLFRMLSFLAVLTGSLFCIFHLFWGFNYDSLSLAAELGMEVDRYSVKALRLTTESFAAELNAIAGDVPRDADGVSDFGAFATLAAQAREGWRALAAADPAFDGVVPSLPKPVLASEAMSYTGITGIFIPFTGEANVNRVVPDSSIPFTMSHELAHAAGVAPENEANYAAFLACRSNPNIAFRYSGYLTAFIYSYNALVKEDADTAYEIRRSLDPRVEADLASRAEYWKKYDGKVSAAATKVNNTYLMAMNQTDGVKSYGMVVDLLIADYVSRNGNPDVN